MEYVRLLQIKEAEEDSVFLWGPRQVGKSSLLRKLFPEALFYDLLKSEECERFSRRPSLLREEVLAQPADRLVIIDEVQKVPELLDEAHWLICNRGTRFVLCGSSARKLKTAETNLLGGRALKCELFPLVSAEITDFDLIKAVNVGTVPRHYIATESLAQRRLQAYVGVYLEEEIRRKAQLRNLAAFNRFLEVAAGCDGEMVNYTNIAQDCGVSATSVKEYFNILEQTLIGFMLPAYTASQKRRVIGAPKFYYFDVGIANYLRKMRRLQPGSVDFGHAFEHFVIQELRAWVSYSHSAEWLGYWRTSSGHEVDCVLGDGRVAIEIKSVAELQHRHLKGLRTFKEDNPQARLIAVTLDRERRMIGDVEVWPAVRFLQMLWAGGIE